LAARNKNDRSKPDPTSKKSARVKARHLSVRTMFSLKGE